MGVGCWRGRGCWPPARICTPRGVEGRLCTSDVCDSEGVDVGPCQDLYPEGGGEGGLRTSGVCDSEGVGVGPRQDLYSEGGGGVLGAHRSTHDAHCRDRLRSEAGAGQPRHVTHVLNQQGILRSRASLNSYFTLSQYSLVFWPAGKLTNKQPHLFLYQGLSVETFHKVLQLINHDL